MPNKSAASIVAEDKRHRRIRRRRWLIGGGLIAALLLFGFFGLPPIIKAQAIKRLSAELHREVAIERIRLNPLVLSITIEGLVIKDRDGGAFTRWKRLYVNFDSFSLFTSEWRFQEIDLDGFSQRVAIDQDGVFNFADLIPAPAEAPADSPGKNPRPIRIANLTVTSAAFAFSDASRAHPFATEVGPLAFTLKNFLTAGHPKAPYEFSAATESGETLAWRGTLSINPVRSAGEFSLDGIALKKYAPYYVHLFNADVLSGRLDVSAAYAVDLSAESPQVSLTDAAIKLSRLQVAARGSTTSLIDLPSFTIDGLSADGLKPSATIKRVGFDGGRLTVVREADGSINLLKLLSAPETATAVDPVPTAAVQANPPVLPDVKLAEFALSGLAIDFEDRTTPNPAKNGISRLDVSVKNISLAEPASTAVITLAATTIPGGSIKVEGSVVREPLSADLGITVSSLPLGGITPYIEPFLNLRIAGGTVAANGSASLRGAVAGFKGDVIVDQFALVDGVKAEEFAGFTQLAIQGIDAVSAPLSARIAEIKLVAPTARVVINADKTTNLDPILRRDAVTPGSVSAGKPVTAPVSDAAAPVVAPAWSLGKFTLISGAFTLADRSVKPAARIALDHFSGTVAGLSSADLQRGDVDIRGKLNGSGTIALTGKLDAKAATHVPGALTEIVVDVKGVDLSPIAPYIGTYAGYELARSGLAVDVKARLSQRKLATENVVTLNQFTLGAATNSPDATKLPVRLGVALLKDSAGNIVLDVPVNGDLDDPEFKIGRVVMRVIGNLLVKAATSPFSLIGSAFGGGGDELAYQEFAAGSVTPSEVEMKKIDTLRKALKGRPALNLDITGSYDATTDLAAIREQILDRQVRFRRWEELRSVDASLHRPDQVVVFPEDEERIIRLFVAERYAGGQPVIAADGTPVPPQPVYKPMPVSTPKPKAPLLRRNQRVFSGANVFNSRIPKAAKSAVESVPVPVPVAAEPALANAEGAPAPLSLAEAKLALASGIPVADDVVRHLATERAQHVRDALLAGGEIDETRLFINPPAAEGKGTKVFLQLR